MAWERTRKTGRQIYKKYTANITRRQNIQEIFRGKYTRHEIAIVWEYTRKTRRERYRECVRSMKT